MPWPRTGCDGRGIYTRARHIYNAINPHALEEKKKSERKAEKKKTKHERQTSGTTYPFFDLSNCTHTLVGKTFCTYLNLARGIVTTILGGIDQRRTNSIAGGPIK